MKNLKYTKTWKATFSFGSYSIFVIFYSLFKKILCYKLFQTWDLPKANTRYIQSKKHALHIYLIYIFVSNILNHATFNFKLLCLHSIPLTHVLFPVVTLTWELPYPLQSVIGLHRSLDAELWVVNIPLFPPPHLSPTVSPSLRPHLEYTLYLSTHPFHGGSDISSVTAHITALLASQHTAH